MADRHGCQGQRRRRRPASSRTQSSIGYVEQAYALQNNFTFADVKNKAGQYIAPTLEATSAAGEGVDPPEDLRFSTINAEGDATYPIAAVTFMLVHQDVCKGGLAADKAALVKGWLDYALGDGQEVAKELQYAPLPAAVLKQGQGQGRRPAVQRAAHRA